MVNRKPLIKNDWQLSLLNSNVSKSLLDINYHLHHYEQSSDLSTEKDESQSESLPGTSSSKYHLIATGYAVLEMLWW